MTAPIQEPTLQRKDAVLTWGQNQLFRRPAPPTDEGGSVESAIFFGWNADTSNEFPPNTLRTICNATNDSYFETYWLSHPASSPAWQMDFDAGVVQKDESAHYRVACELRFADDFAADDFLGVCIDIGNLGSFASKRVWNWYQDPDHILYGEYFFAAADQFGNATFRVSLYHNAAVNITLTDAALYVNKFANEADGETFQRP